MNYHEKRACIMFFKREINDTELAKRLRVKGRNYACAKAGRAVRDLIDEGLLKTNSDV